MAVGDTRQRLDLAAVPPRAAGGDDVRHFDQLSHREQRCFLRLYRGDDPDRAPFEAGEVVVFTDYYRVERVDRR